VKVHKMRWIAWLGLAALVTGIAAQTAVEPGRDWWRTVQLLADDNMEGRLTGSEGYRRAAQYVATEFQRDGLQPAGVEGYMQPVRFDVQRVLAEQSHITLADSGVGVPLIPGDDIILGSRLPQPKEISAPLVFVGYGLHIPSAGYDDFQGIDLKGKIIVSMNGGPANIPGPIKSSSRAAQDMTPFLEGRGVAGMISIPDAKSMDIPWSRVALSASQPGMRLADADLQNSHGPMFTATINPKSAEKLFAASGHSYQELLVLADAGKPLPGFPLHGTIHAQVATRSETVESSNIAGVLPGSDPQLKNEYVVFSAHLDHLGIGEPIQGDKIYNGAMDDASGVASEVEVARELHDGGAKLQRSVLFLVVCGEEKGLLGSRYFAAHPTVPRERMVADLNTDMFLPLFPLQELVVYGGDESSLGPEMSAVAAAVGVKVIPDREPNRNIFIRSDQYNFIRAGVPAVMPAFAGEPGSPQEKIQGEWLANRYHAPSDDANQPVDLAAAAKFNGIMRAFLEKVANDPNRPVWNSSSVFKRFATQE
jgi:Zn-dependent M28 family amino/carboxypeptidase